MSPLPTSSLVLLFIYSSIYLLLLFLVILLLSMIEGVEEVEGEVP